MNTNIVRADRDGVEFFTVLDTGRSGMSTRGLARALSVSSSSVTYLIKAIGKTDNEILKPLKTMDIYLENVIGNGHRKIISDEACAVIATHFAVQQGRTEAVRFLATFTAIGLRTYIQRQTGWSAPVAKATKYLTGVVTPKPKAWEIYFCAEWRENASRLIEQPWQGFQMARFINTMVYDYFPMEVSKELDLANPPRKGQRRARHQHRHISPAIDHLLRAHISETLTLMEASNSKEQLESLMSNRFRNGSKIGSLAECKRLALPD